MKFRPCPWSFFSGMLLPVLLGVLVFAQAPKPKVAPKPSAPIVLSPDYARVAAIITRLEALEAQRTASHSGLPSVPQSDPWAKYRQASSAPLSTVTARAPPVPNYTLPARVAENGSYYGERNVNGVPKTVYVEGYYRRDGTYVRGHYRSSPGSNP